VIEGVGSDGIKSDSFADHRENLFYGYGVEAQSGVKLDISYSNTWKFRENTGASNARSKSFGWGVGATERVFEYRDSGGTRGAEGRLQVTESVSTTATGILTDIIQGALVNVVGIDGSVGATSSFTDVINVKRFGNANAIDKNGRTGAATRTYNMNGGTIELTMGSGSYDVVSYGANLRPL
jgi:hypothetical protein